MSQSVIVEADGGSRGNPGPAGYGAVVRSASGKVLAERKASIGVATNNVAEYRGLIAGLSAALDLGATDVVVRMDSKLVIEQVAGRWKVKHAGLQPLAAQARELVARFASSRLEWVPRLENSHADRLANEAMDAAAGVSPAAPVAAWAPSLDAPTRLVLMRHASTVHTLERRFSGRNDLPLSEAGELEARALAVRVRAFADVAAVVCSPLRRAVQTASIIGGEVQVLSDLTETDFGAWEGLTFAEASAGWPAELAAWLASPDAAPPDGESFASVAVRVARVRDDLIARYPGQTVVVVTHVTPIKTLLRLALDAPPTALFRLHLDPASVSVIDYFADGNCSVRLVNEVPAPAV